MITLLFIDSLKKTKFREIEGGINTQKGIVDGIVAAFDYKGTILNYFFGKIIKIIL